MPFLPIRLPADLQRFVLNKTREDHWLDFKREPHGRNDSGRVECARDVAQFTNASGGVLMIGAVETAHVLSGWQTITNPDDYIHWADDVVKGNLTPTPAVESHVLQVPSGEVVVALNIPPSFSLIARRQNDGYEFPIRAGDSRRYMTLMEVEARMQNKERATRLRVERIDPSQPVGLDAFVRRELDHNDWRIVGVDDDVVRLRKDGLEVPVPLTYVETVYRAGEPQAEWILSLSCYLTLHRTMGFIQVTKGQPFGTQYETYRARRMASGGSS